MNTLGILKAWLTARERNGDTPPTSWAQWQADIDHSAYLRRTLVDGKEALPDPPPKAFSYPWYELVDAGAFDVHDSFVHVHQTADPMFVYTQPCVNICQSVWPIVRTDGADDHVVRYLGRGGLLTGPEYRLRRLNARSWRLEVMAK